MKEAYLYFICNCKLQVRKDHILSPSNPRMEFKYFSAGRGPMFKVTDKPHALKDGKLWLEGRNDEEARYIFSSYFKDVIDRQNALLRRNEKLLQTITTQVDDGGERITYGETGATREPSDGKGHFDLVTPFGMMRLAKWYEAGARHTRSPDQPKDRLNKPHRAKRRLP